MEVEITTEEEIGTGKETEVTGTELLEAGETTPMTEETVIVGTVEVIAEVIAAPTEVAALTEIAQGIDRHMQCRCGRTPLTR